MFYAKTDKTSVTIRVGLKPMSDGSCDSANGLHVCVQAQNRGDADDLLGRITLLGPDESRWTTNVVT